MRQRDVELVVGWLCWASMCLIRFAKLTFERMRMGFGNSFWMICGVRLTMSKWM
jgi:hypothetical protein